MANEFTLSAGELPPKGLPRNSVGRITDHPDLTSVINRGPKALYQTDNKYIFGL